MNSKEKMLKYLSKTNGYNTFTTAQARSMFGIKNVAARIQELRQEGHPIYTNTKVLADGRKITFYRLGTPSRKLISAGYMLLSAIGDKSFT